MRYLLNTTFLALSLSVAACAQDAPAPSKPVARQESAQPAPQSPAAKPAAKLPADPNKYAVIITGIGGEEAYVKQFGEWTAKLHDAMTTQLGFAENQVFVLTEKPEGGQPVHGATLGRPSLPRKPVDRARAQDVPAA